MSDLLIGLLVIIGIPVAWLGLYWFLDAHDDNRSGGGR